MEVIDKTLTIDEQPILNNSIQKENLINVFPTSGSNLNENGEINFVIETFDQYLLPSRSYIYIEANLTDLSGKKLKQTIVDTTTGKIKTPADEITLTNNAPMFLFDRATYSLNGDQIENVRDPGRVSLIKGVLSYSSNLDKRNTFGWILDDTPSFKYKMDKYTEIRNGKLSFCIPLTHIFGFAECYKKVIYGVKHSLALHRNSDNKNSIFTLEPQNLQAKITITKINWLIPKISPSLEMENKLMNMIENKKTFSLPYISRQLEDNNVPMSARDFTWKLGTKYEKLKYLIIGFQKNRENNFDNAARFDHCNLETIFVELNSERYPYECLKCDFSIHNAVQQYNFAKEFKNSYYKTYKEHAFIDEEHYNNYYPLFVIDVSKQNERIHNTRPDITIKATFSKAIPADTKAYCLILSDNLIEINGDGLRVNVKK
jgi:hypothetical protein